jgi:hypothetical protein
MILMNFIIISDESVNKSKLFEDVFNLKIMPIFNTKIPICIKLGKYNNDYKIIHKSKEYILNHNEITDTITGILNKLSNDIYFDEIIIEINSTKNIEYYDLPSYKFDFIDDKLLSLYNKYLKLDNIFIINNISLINNSILNDSLNLIINYRDDDTIMNIQSNENIVSYNYDKSLFTNIDDIDFTQYKYYIYNNNNLKKYLVNSGLYEINSGLNEINSGLNEINIINKLYLDFDNYYELERANYEEFFNHIYTLNKYRHYHYYNCNNYSTSLTNYLEIKTEFYSKNYELLDEYKNYEDIINKSIELFDITFDKYIKKLEPEILKYFLIIYHNKDYDDTYEDNKYNDLILMLKGLKKMCLLVVKKKLNN